MAAYFLICLYILYVAYPPPAIVPPIKTGTVIIPPKVVVIVIDWIVANALPAATLPMLAWSAAAELPAIGPIDEKPI